MKITYCINGKSEVLIIKDDDGNIIKKGLYSIGNCLVDIVYGAVILHGDTIINIDPEIKTKITNLLEKCGDYLHNDIKKVVEKNFEFVFKNKFSYQNVFIENKLSRVYMMNEINTLICFLVTLIYTRKLMYKRCAYCNRIFATRYSKAKFCKRIATKSGKTCGYASTLKKHRQNGAEKNK